MTEYFDFPEQNRKDVEEFSKGYAKIATGKENGRHDGLIALKGALCRTDNWENLAESTGKLAVSTDKPVYPENVEIYIDDALHCYNLMAINSSYCVKYGRMFFHSSKYIDPYIKFFEKHNHLDRKR